jgi:hypothetical protein
MDQLLEFIVALDHQPTVGNCLAVKARSITGTL